MHSTEDAQLRFSAYAVSILKDAQRVIALQALFECGNQASIAEALDQTVLAPAAIVVRSAILESLCVALSRMNDGRSDKHSLENAVEVGTRLMDSTGSIDQPNAIADFIASVEQLRLLNARAKLKNLRDYAIAHSIPSKLNASERPLVEDMYAVAEATLRAAYLLGIAANASFVSTSATMSVRKCQAQSYFEKLIQ